MDDEIRKIIPCIDIKDGKAVKGVNFEGVKLVGSIVDLAQKYADDGADEIVLLDISATIENRKNNLKWIEETIQKVDANFTVGGGISSVEDAQILFEMGAKKVSISSSALNNPDLINELVTKFSSNSVVVAIDAKQVDGVWMVFQSAGTVNSNRTLVAWAKEAEDRGAGAILFTSIDHDGEQKGYPLDALAEIKKQVSIPLIASGGAGTMADFYQAIATGKADAVLAASVFHFNTMSVADVKFMLWRASVCVDLGILFKKAKFDENGLIPAVVQDVGTGVNLMLGYMNRESLDTTIKTGMVTFWSRSRNKLWTKGEESGHFLKLHSMKLDCDKDTLLVKVEPIGPTCHKGTDTCWREMNQNDNFLFFLESVLRERKFESSEKSYTASLYQKGTAKIAQKVGEEAVELVIEAMRNKDDLFLNEAADLMYHYLVLLIDKGYGLTDVIKILKDRHK